MKKYFAVPAAHCATYGDIIDFAENAGFIRTGNDLCGSRQYNAKTGVIVFKIQL